MRWAVLGDIHANPQALHNVLAAVRADGAEALRHVGDVVGYGAAFSPVIGRLRREQVRGVMGNHELMVLGELPVNPRARAIRQAVDFTRARIAPDERAYLAALPRYHVEGDLVFFHATPDTATRYVTDAAQAADVFDQLDRQADGWRVAFHGHTHVQRVFERVDGRVRLALAGDGDLFLRPGGQYLVCPGSVGMSRDADPRSAYLVYDDAAHALRQRRIVYDWRATARGNEAEGLTARLFLPAPTLGHRIRRLAARALGVG